MPPSILADLLIRLGLDAAAFKAGIAGVGAQIGSLGTTATTTGTKLAALGKAPSFALGAQGLSTLVLALGQVGAHYGDLELAQVRLRQAVENTGVTWKQYETRIKSVTDAGQRFGFATDDVLGAFSLLVAQTGSVEEALKRQGTAYDLARASGNDLATVSRLLGKVNDDTLKTIGRMGFAFQNVGTEEELFAQISQRVMGQAAAQANTMTLTVERWRNALQDSIVSVGGFMANAAPQALLLAVALRSLGVSADVVTGALTRMGAALLGLVVPVAVVTLGLAALFGLIYVVGKAGVPGFSALSEEMEQIAAIISKVGLAGFIAQLTGAGQQAQATATDFGILERSFKTLRGAYDEVIERFMESGALPAVNIFKQAEDAARSFGLQATQTNGILNEMRDLLFGTTGLSAIDAMRKVGQTTVDQVARNERARELDGLESMRDAAREELDAVARFHQDNADRAADFAERLADKAKGIVETIDQLNKDLGPGRDQNRRRLQAEALKARLAEEIADMEADERKRLARLRAPSTPTLDKLPGATTAEKLATLDERIARSAANYEKFVAGLTDLLDLGVQRLIDKIETAQSLVNSRRMIEMEPGPHLAPGSVPAEMRTAIADFVKAGERERELTSRAFEAERIIAGAQATGQLVQVKFDFGSGPLDALGLWLQGVFSQAEVEIRAGGRSVSGLK